MMEATPPEAMGRLIRETFRAMTRCIEHQFEQTEIIFSQWLALKLVDEGGIRCVTDVNRELGIQSGAATRLVDRLESQGLLRRCRSGIDRRVVQLELTNDGRATVIAMQSSLTVFWARHLTMFSDRDQQEFFSMLTRLRDSLLVQTLHEQGARIP